MPPSVLTYPGVLPPATLLLLLQSFLLKSLARSSAFIACSTSLCPYGFLSLSGKAERLTCPLCAQTQAVQRGKVEELDPSFKAMIREGTLRGCPACGHYTMKERGICNVLECAKCGVWWNWRTRETGRSSTELKERARQMGTLWEHGELPVPAGQQRTTQSGARPPRLDRPLTPPLPLSLSPALAQLLQHSNPSEFKALLERNGQRIFPTSPPA